MYSANVKMYQDDYEYQIMIKRTEELDKLYAKAKDYTVHVSISREKDSKTMAQMRALRALISAFFFSGASSCPDDIDTLDKFTIWVKLQISYSIDMDIHGRTIPIPRSFADASKEEMTDCIENVLKLIDMAQATNDEKIQTIIAGMKSNELY